jgi:hypothetical protein
VYGCVCMFFFMDVFIYDKIAKKNLIFWFAHGTELLTYT